MKGNPIYPIGIKCSILTLLKVLNHWLCLWVVQTALQRILKDKLKNECLLSFKSSLMIQFMLNQTHLKRLKTTPLESSESKRDPLTSEMNKICKAKDSSPAFQQTHLTTRMCSTTSQSSLKRSLALRIKIFKSSQRNHHSNESQWLKIQSKLSCKVGSYFKVQGYSQISLLEGKS